MSYVSGEINTRRVLAPLVQLSAVIDTVL